MTLDDGGQSDRGALMRQWLIRFVEERPFSPFIIRLEGGFELEVRTPEAIIFEPGVLVASVYQSQEGYDVFPVERIVSLRALG